LKNILIKRRVSLFFGGKMHPIDQEKLVRPAKVERNDFSRTFSLEENRETEKISFVAQQFLFQTTPLPLSLEGRVTS
jgi:hypothetical protein